MEIPKIVNPFVWVEIYVNDLQRAAAFYKTVFQVELTPLPNPTPDELQMLAFPSEMMGAGASGSLVYMKGFEAGTGNSTIVYFNCSDCAVEESRVEAAGGKIFKPKMALGEYGFMSLIIDSEGNMIGLHSLA